MAAEQKCTKFYQINETMQIHESLQRQEITSYMFHYYSLLVMIKKVPTYVCLCVFLPSLIGIIRLIVMVSLRWKVLTQNISPVAQSTVEVSFL